MDFNLAIEIIKKHFSASYLDPGSLQYLTKFSILSSECQFNFSTVSTNLNSAYVQRNTHQCSCSWHPDLVT